MAAIDRVRADTSGPGQRLAIATLEVCARVLARDNDVTIRWVPAHHRVTSDEIADDFAKAAAEGSAPRDDVPDEYRPLPHDQSSY